MIYYCHWNAQHHGFVNGFKEWEFSSYNEIIKNDNSLVAAEKVIQRFGSISAFEQAHKIYSENKELDKYLIEH